MLLVIGWLTVLGLGVARVAIPDRLGPDLQPDFLHFYTIGDLARTGDTAALYDGPAQYARQIALVPASDNGLTYRPVYSPLVALAFAPVTRLPWVAAWALWGLLTLALYLWTLRAVHGRLGDIWPYVLAFPPIWELVAAGQTGILPFLGFAWAGVALERNRPLLAGLAFSLLALKPHHAILLAVVLVLAQEWRIIAGAVLGGAIHLAASVALVGRSVTLAYVQTVISVARTAGDAEPKPFLQHSIRVLTSQLPGHAGQIAYLVLSGIVVVAVWHVWRQVPDWRIRMAVAVIGAALGNPHFFVYDAIVLVLPAIWLRDAWAGDLEWLWARAYLLSVVLLIPTAYLVPVQASVLVLAELLWHVSSRGPLITASLNRSHPRTHSQAVTGFPA